MFLPCFEGLFCQNFQDSACCLHSSNHGAFSLSASLNTAFVNISQNAWRNLDEVNWKLFQASVVSSSKKTTKGAQKVAANTVEKSTSKSKNSTFFTKTR